MEVEEQLNVNAVNSSKQAHHLLGRKPLSETSAAPFQLAPPIICVHCNAKKFTGELDGFCCSTGKIALVDVEVSIT
ncbi:12781_t:CDS:2 [Gigaspora margarita]|uniref:12781_t:CDS:1 n=1 Tax=Gigaspora margarita TaxID=4874 RepID=A0ABN7VDE4_GIGMA|nr:12781_t:CDS:2 [Gigaspora margarita]